MLAQALTGESKQDEDEVYAQSPEAGNQGDAHDATALEYSAANTRADTRYAVMRHTSGDGVLAASDAWGGLGNNVDLRDVVLGAREAGVVRDTVLSRDSRVLVRVRSESVEPGDAKESRVQGVDDRVEGVKVGKQNSLEGALQPDVPVEETCGEEGKG